MSSDYHQLIGSSSVVQRLDQAIESAASSDAKVLIVGESGVGKEIVARLIHARSRRRVAPMITMNCASVPDTLLESEMFGHLRGSFTGAYRDRPGVLQMAHRGTLFMDEVGEMSLRMQGLLLRFLETGEIQRVGDTRTEPKVDVRVIAATNRNLAEQLASQELPRRSLLSLECHPYRGSAAQGACRGRGSPSRAFPDDVCPAVSDSEAGVHPRSAPVSRRVPMARERAGAAQLRGTAHGDRRLAGW